MNEDLDVDAELGFEPAVSATGAEPGSRATSTTAATTGATAAATAGKRRRSGLRRRVTAGAVMVGALGLMGGGYAVFAASSGAANDLNSSSSAIAEGHQLYETSCITCHGANLQGVENRGPSLIGVGGAAVDFQVSTGRMPATGQGAEEYRKTAKFTEEQSRALAAYVQSVGGGPAVPTGSVRNMKDVADGGELFRLNCASCHGTTFKGAPLSAGKTAPSLNAATDTQIYEAMLTGPENMPVFSNNELTVSEKKAIVAYIQTIKASNDPGGSGIGRIGPVSEGLVIWVVGIGALMIAILWIGAKSQ